MVRGMLSANAVVVSLPSRHSRFWLTLCAALLAASCKGDVPADQVDSDGDNVPDQSEDRNQNGMIDPGETDPNVADTDGDGIDDTQEVSTLACAKVNDRPFDVFD